MISNNSSSTTLSIIEETATLTDQSFSGGSPIDQPIKSTFTIVESMNQSSFELDSINGISRVKWVGTVNLETAKRLLTLGGDSVEFDGYKRLMIDRYELKEFDTDARIWIKELFKTRAKKLSKEVDRMAIINPKTSMAGIFSNMLTSAISLVMPGLLVKKFDSREKGISWLLE